ncbi:MAG TPA: hypothetical protein PKH10_02425 [bacterium]|nr:hypothetical protein [bacterium]
MARPAPLIILLSTLLVGCAAGKETVWPTPEHPEEEPNNDPPGATIIEEAVTYEGVIDDERPATSDTDHYRLLGHAGFIYRVEFETLDPDLLPLIEIADNGGLLKEFRPPGNARSVVEFFEPAEGNLILRVSDEPTRRNTPETWEDFRYWLRVTKRWACEYPASGDLAAGKPLAFDMEKPPAVPRLFTIDATAGHYAVAVASERLDRDKKLVAMDCVTGEVIGGSDDRDPESGLTDPYWYEHFGAPRDMRLIVERWSDAAGDRAPDKKGDPTTLTLTRHDPSHELEPNDIVEYANVCDPAGTAGELDAEQKVIAAVLQDDRDWFKHETTRGAVARFALSAGAAGEMQVSLGSSSTDMGGYTLLSIRSLAVSFDAAGVAEATAFLPFTGTLYLGLQGSGMGYEFTYEEDEAIAALEGVGAWPLELPHCRGAYRTWRFPPFVNAVRLSLDSSDGDIAWRIYNGRRYPLIELGAAGAGAENVWYLTRLSDETDILFAVEPSRCDAAATQEATLTVTEAPFMTEEPDLTTTDLVVEAVPGTTYIGWFDTDVPIIENRWTFTPGTDGTLFLMTTPVKERGGATVDTVIRLYEDGNDTPIAQNDDMIEGISFSPYSFLRHPLKGGATYTISVKPFMDDSSNIAAMNIHANFGLDVRFE